jgi:hypothetical protein
MESKVENSTKGPESSDKCESNTFTCLWLFLVNLLEQLKNIAVIGNNCDDGCGHFFENGLETGCFLSCKERKVGAEFGILELL